MALDPMIKAFLDQFNALPKVPVDQIDPKAYREMESRSLLMAQPQEPIAKTGDFTIPLDGRDIRVRFYYPTEEGPMPALVYYHGGGWVIGSLETHDSVCRALANHAGCAVFSVDYRLAPESKFPAAVHDAYDSLVWIANHASDLGILPDRIAVGGDSAGGNLAAVACLIAKERKGPRIAHQLLFYPSTGFTELLPSLEENAEGYMLTGEMMEWFRKQYLNNEEENLHPYFAPVVVEDLSGLPPATILTAQFDPLRDVGRAYADKLRANGVETSYKNYEDLIHGFTNFLGFVPSARKAVEEAAEQLKKSL